MMSHQTFYEDNVTLANSLAGTAELTADRIVERDITIQDDDTLLPAIMLWPGDGQMEFDYFPATAGIMDSGTWAVVWHAFLPLDPNATTAALRQAYAARWEALTNAVKAKLMDPQALIAPTRPIPAEVRWGEEPPLWLMGGKAPQGMTLWFTVQQREF